MQVLKEEIRIKIENAAKELFLKNGFEKTSMQKIAKKAGISKSNLYNYFTGKEEIFYHLTSSAYNKISNILDVVLIHECTDDFDVKEYITFVSNEVEKLLIDFREEMILIMDCSIGTTYEKSKEKLIARLQEHLKNELIRYNNSVEDEDDFISHFTAASLIEGVLEINRHGKSDLWIKRNIRKLMEYFIMGYATWFDK